MFLSVALMIVFCIILYILSTFKKRKKSFNFRVLSALLVGLVFGGIINFFVNDKEVINNLVVFMSIFGTGYISLLKMMVIPLILVAMTTAIMNSKSGSGIIKIAPKVILMLMVTVAIAAIIGIVAVYAFSIDGGVLANAVAGGDDVLKNADLLKDESNMLGNLNYAQYIVSIIPTNIFKMLTGSESTSTLSTVLFSMFLGYSVLQVKKRKPEKVQSFIDFMNSLKEVVLSMVREVLKLTPYAIAALMASFAATSNLSSLAEMGKFLIASYVAILVMYLIHLLIISINGLNPITYAKKTWPVLLFGFGSRSSMAALPLNIETQTDALGVDEETASISGTFGTSIGQNGCAGIYPAMLAVMVAVMSGINIDIFWIIKLILVVTVASFGIAGVGGGATFAAIAVLSIMGLDITIAAILVSIEPLIDMARTALNISDSMLAGVVVAKNNKSLDVDVYNSDLEVTK
ncbi:MAG: cation:dicarboxylate symporter family transporter [Mycoplasmatales bacterium]